MRAAQSIGRSLSLGEIREVHSVRDRGQAPCAHVASLIEEHARDLDERLRQLQKMQRELGRLSIVARSLPRASGKFCHIIELARPS
ncbi:MAG: MerR family DNA-binding protein [Actinomycetota bacterium]